MSEERTMAIAAPDEAALDEKTRAYFALCREKIGFVPNVFRAQARDPERFRRYSAYRNDLMRSTRGISPVEREMVAVTVSSANRCHYCLVAHGQVLRELTGDPVLADTIGLNYRAAALSPRHRAMLDFAWKLTLAPGEVGDGDRQALAVAGFDEDGVAEIAEVAAFYNMTNRYAIALGIAPNREYYAMSR